MKRSLWLGLVTAVILLLTACGGNEESTQAKQPAEQEVKELKIGATAGPYSDMVSKAIKPIMEDKGYKIEVVEFSDYVQPNLALANGSINANLFQHLVYLKKFSEDKGLELSEIIIVPTAPMGIYSNKYKAIEEIEEGSSIAIANDPTNLARTLLLLKDAGLITIADGIDPLKVSEKDIKDNLKNLEIKPIEAAQLPRAVESVDVSAVPGNFALASKMDITAALQLENMPDNYRNQLVVKTEDADKQFTKDLKETIESDEFEQIIDEQFQGFQKPDWMLNK